MQRGVEQGFSVIRAANQGVMTVSDPYGRVLNRRRAGAGALETLVADAPLGPIPTLYGVIGNAFGWACVTFVAAALAFRDFQRRRRRGSPS